jgi:CO/xanthine dehydrogenase Mo-binding subunit
MSNYLTKIEENTMNNHKYIGKSSIRVDGKVKITGAAQFVDDIDFGPNLLYAEIVESPYAHAIINTSIHQRRKKYLAL